MASGKRLGMHGKLEEILNDMELWANVVVKLYYY